MRDLRWRNRRRQPGGLRSGLSWSTSAVGAMRRGTPLRSMRVKCCPTPKRSRPYLINCWRVRPWRAFSSMRWDQIPQGDKCHHFVGDSFLINVVVSFTFGEDLPGSHLPGKAAPSLRHPYQKACQDQRRGQSLGSAMGTLLRRTLDFQNDKNPERKKAVASPMGRTARHLPGLPPRNHPTNWLAQPPSSLANLRWQR